MGVPAFFRWLSRKYPSVVVNCVEATPRDVNGKLEPIDPTAPNPNGIEFDNLYLDMNGIIHPCTHPEDKPAPADEDEMMIAIFEAIDRMLNIVRPRKILYMAIDGVAPRAKMNQQRSRRFRATKETTEKIIEVNKIREKLLADGAILPPAKEAGSHFDSNCITPGTPFMDRLSKCLHYYAHNKLNSDPAWKDLKIILSDANVPGEGEHKIMDFIRKQRAQPDHDPNTVHCLCGADADLIMLGLATHEPHFYIIREEFKTNMDRPCDICGRNGHEMKSCTGLERNEEIIKVYSSEVQFIFVRLAVLREYLRRELEMPGLPFQYDFERTIDDWVFMCFFVGNDFLPHLPSLEIREGAIDRLVGLYKKAVYKTGGYLTENGQVALNRVQLIMSELGVMEDEIFKKRQQTEEMFRARDKAKRRRMRNFNNRDRPNHMLSGQYAPSAVGGNVPAIVNPRQEAFQLRTQSYHTQANANSGGGPQNAFNRGEKRPAQGPADDSDEEVPVNDEVRLWESGFKDRYYESKFDVSKENLGFRQKVALEYIRGLCWVLHYYYQGCPCWKWYFPYHYAPFASDFIDIASFPVVFEKGTQPFNPLEQLMSVFPAASKQHVPEPWSTLMFDPFSPIIDFYPEDFKIDLNGKKFAWQGVALLPFVDEERLHKALAPLYPQLSDEEKRRNTRGDSILYVSQYHGSFSFIRGLYDNKSNFELDVSLKSDGMLGRVLLASNCVNRGGSLVSPVRGLQVIRDNQVVCVRFRDPAYSDDHIFSTERLTGASDPQTILKPQNLPDEVSMNWKPRIGMVMSNQQASLGVAGHRMLGHYTHHGNPRNAQPGAYSAVPPPSMADRNNRFNSRNNYHPYNRNDNNRYGNRGNDFNRGNDYNRGPPRTNDSQSGRPPSYFSQQRQEQRSTGSYSTNRNEHVAYPDQSTSRNEPRYAKSYTVSNDRSQRPPQQNHNPHSNRPSGGSGYQTFQPRNQTGGPRPPGYYTDQSNYGNRRQQHY
ncbi:5'-3' exoribonuclease 2 homolog [Planococcus citri]|uniref:5'-3' exoribonuclease 2 homolog n=1 Tax=Planococcus citri TaxID=170843 RepID=UPI0031F7B4A9